VLAGRGHGHFAQCFCVRELVKGRSDPRFQTKMGKDKDKEKEEEGEGGTAFVTIPYTLGMSAALGLRSTFVKTKSEGDQMSPTRGKTRGKSIVLSVMQLAPMAWGAAIPLLMTSHAGAQFTSPIVLDADIAGTSSKILVADLNNDNNDDIVVTRRDGFTREIRIYSGNGDATFSPPHTINPTGHTPSSLAIGDLNGDGFDDIVSTSVTPGEGFVWFPNSAGSFSNMITIDTEFHRFSDCRVVDTDNDGDLDILAIGDIVFVHYANDGSGQFTKSIIPPVVITENYAFEVADINNDGYLDAIIAGIKTFIYINNTDNTFTYNPTISDSLFDIPSLSFSVLAKDFDHDGDQDLIIGDTNQRNYWWYEQQNDGLFTFRQIISTGIFQSHSIAAADFDNDSYFDLITNFPQLGQTVWFKGNGAGDFETATLIHQGTVPHPQHVATGDFNNDGTPDAVWSLPLSVHLSTAQASCPPDLTDDNMLNFFDISAFLAAFVAQDPVADFTQDDIFNFFDISAFLKAFAEGCP